MALAWEVITWLKNRDPGFGFSTATVVEGPKRRKCIISLSLFSITSGYQS